MNKLERLEQEAFDDQVAVYDYYLGEDNLKGYYADGNVAINTCVDTAAERMCVLAEELGHHHTSVGNILDMSDSGNRKQERQARLWASTNWLASAELSTHTKRDVKPDTTLLSTWR